MLQMSSQQEREESLRRLRLLIATHTPTPQDQLTLEKAQRGLERRIQLKYQKSTANQKYVFPRQYQVHEEPAGSVQTVDLKESLPENEVPLRPKIKLAKNRLQKRAKTEYIYDENVMASVVNQLKHCDLQKRESRRKQEQMKMHILPLKEAKNSFRLEIREASFPNQEETGLNRTSKSKLNFLTQSYAQLKNTMGTQLKEDCSARANLGLAVQRIPQKDRSMSHLTTGERKIEGTPSKDTTLQLQSRNREKVGLLSEKSGLKAI